MGHLLPAHTDDAGCFAIADFYQGLLSSTIGAMQDCILIGTKLESIQLLISCIGKGAALGLQGACTVCVKQQAHLTAVHPAHITSAFKVGPTSNSTGGCPSMHWMRYSTNTVVMPCGAVALYSFAARCSTVRQSDHPCSGRMQLQRPPDRIPTSAYLVTCLKRPTIVTNGVSIPAKYQ